MRRVLLAVVAAFALGATAMLPTGPPASAATVGPAAGVVDAACAHGRGVAVSVPSAWMTGVPEVATTMLPDGDTVIVVSAGYPTASYAIVRAFTPNCTPDPTFGRDGYEQLRLGGSAFSITAAIPARGGGLVLAGARTSVDLAASRWLVGRLSANGSLDPHFGAHGWEVLPWPGSATALAETGTGDIVVGGSQGGGCCVRAWAGELMGNGAPVASFGAHGRTPVPVVRDDSTVASVVVAPDRHVLVLTAGGNMGYWGVNVSAFTAGGSPVPAFALHFTAAMRRVAPSGVFVGDLVLHGSGFLLVGTEQSGPVGATPNRTARGRVAAFLPSGRLETRFGSGGMTTFHASMAGGVEALPRRGGGVLMVASSPFIQARPSARASLDLFGLSAGGRLDRSFGYRGTARLVLPYAGQDLSAADVPVTMATDGRTSAVVTSSASGTGLLLREIRG